MSTNARSMARVSPVGSQPGPARSRSLMVLIGLVALIGALLATASPANAGFNCDDTTSNVVIILFDDANSPPLEVAVENDQLLVNGTPCGANVVSLRIIDVGVTPQNEVIIVDASSPWIVNGGMVELDLQLTSSGAGSDTVRVIGAGNTDMVDLLSKRVIIDKASNIPGAVNPDGQPTPISLTMGWDASDRDPALEFQLGGGADTFGIVNDGAVFTRGVTVDGGPGNDTINGTGFNDVLSGGDGGDNINAGAGADTVNGGNGDDNLNGGTGNDTIRGHAGDDDLNGGDGNDQLFGGDDDDTVNGGNGNDTARGEAGNDTVRGNAGDDLLLGAGGADTLIGGPGTDTAKGGAGADDLKGNAGNDTLNGGGGADLITGHGGNDIANGGKGADTINGGGGADTMNGNGHNDTMNGGAGNDMMTGGGGADTVRGNGGNDTFNTADNAVDLVSGGKGTKDRCNTCDGNDIVGRDVEIR